MGLLGAYTAGTYVDSMWGVAQFSLSNESPCTCAFVGDKKSVVGKYWPAIMQISSFSDTPSSFPLVAGAISDGAAGGWVLE